MTETVRYGGLPTDNLNWGFATKQEAGSVFYRENDVILKITFDENGKPIKVEWE
ncbi:MAG: hypothetical protein KGL63_11555 [Betaproteobacteria bacterium]|nr:hypothetical protein [Betaproteobacteria bacterium]